jgi:hypothetical protein
VDDRRFTIFRDNEASDGIDELAGPAIGSRCDAAQASLSDRHNARPHGSRETERRDRFDRTPGAARTPFAHDIENDRGRRLQSTHHHDERRQVLTRHLGPRLGVMGDEQGAVSKRR